MKHRTGVLPSDLKSQARSNMNNENIKELARTILAALFMMSAVYFCFLAAATAPEPVVRNEDGARAGSHPVAARRQAAGGDSGCGFDWGGTWERLLDYQHFEYDSAKLLRK